MAQPSHPFLRGGSGGGGGGSGFTGGRGGTTRGPDEAFGAALGIADGTAREGSDDRALAEATERTSTTSGVTDGAGAAASGAADRRSRDAPTMAMAMTALPATIAAGPMPEGGAGRGTGDARGSGVPRGVRPRGTSGAVGGAGTAPGGTR